MAAMIAIRVAHTGVLAFGQSIGQIDHRIGRAPLKCTAVGVAVEVAVGRVEPHLLERLHLVCQPISK